MKTNLITIGFNKNNEADFGISCAIAELDYESMQKLRAIIPVAIHIAEQMWSKALMERPENIAGRAKDGAK